MNEYEEVEEEGEHDRDVLEGRMLRSLRGRVLTVESKVRSGCGLYLVLM